MKTYHEIVVFSETHSLTEIPSFIGITAPEGSPTHWPSYTGRAILTKSQAMVCAGNGDELFQSNQRRKRGNTAIAAEKPVMTATSALPQSLLAILPAICIKLHLDDVKKFVADNSKPADETNEAQLPPEILGMLEFFGLNDENSAKALLHWAGVHTQESFMRSRVKGILSTLIKDIESMDVNELKRLTEVVFMFAIGETDEVPEPEVPEPEVPEPEVTEVAKQPAVKPLKRKG